MTLGPLIIDIAGPQLTDRDRERLNHPMVGGVILFTRNFINIAQLKSLIQEIHALRTPRLLVSVDHEGGRIQRWFDGFTRIPAMLRIGELYAETPAQALAHARACGVVSASELAALGIDLNYAPVLDLGHELSGVLRGGRAFHRNPAIVIAIARAYIKGLNHAGMQAIGKHFPGHGGVKTDSHFALPYDPRTLETLRGDDLLPFQQLIKERLLAGVMTAHIKYLNVDENVATISPFWLQTVLRQQLGFTGAIISDDLGMQAMNYPGGYPACVRRVLQVGCDLILLCNNPVAVDQVLNSLDAWPDSSARIKSLYAHPLVQDPELQNAHGILQNYLP